MERLGIPGLIIFYEFILQNIMCAERSALSTHGGELHSAAIILYIQTFSIVCLLMMTDIRTSRLLQSEILYHSVVVRHIRITRHLFT